MSNFLDFPQTSMKPDKPIRILYSFPHKIGSSRICYTAWQQVAGLANAGAEVLVFPGSVSTALPAGVTVRPTLGRGRIRLPYRVLGTMRSLALHDHVVARRVRKLAGQIDLIHGWPAASLQTLLAASELGIPTVIERPNAHTRYAYESVQAEAMRLGITLPRDNEYAFKSDVLDREEREYKLADFILCPSEFVVTTFLKHGFQPEKLLRHHYGFDEKVFRPGDSMRGPQQGLRMLFVGDCAVRKGVHFALEAWLQSPAHRDGVFSIAGNFLPEYAEKLAPMLRHPSVRVLGHRRDIPELMRDSDVLVLPSIEEGFGLVVAEAIGSGCVPLVSTACTEICSHMENGFVHPIGDVRTLTEQITRLSNDRDLLAQMKQSCLQKAPAFTWRAAGVRLLEVYREVLRRKADSRAPGNTFHIAETMA